MATRVLEVAKALEDLGEELSALGYKVGDTSTGTKAHLLENEVIAMTNIRRNLQDYDNVLRTFALRLRKAQLREVRSGSDS